jgi:hypothetical protein
VPSLAPGMMVGGRRWKAAVRVIGTFGSLVLAGGASLKTSAALCRRPTCCFCCSEPGHRSFDCPRWLPASTQPRLPTCRRCVAWRPTPATAQRPATSPPEAARQPPRRWPRRRRRLASSRSHGALPPPHGMEPARPDQEMVLELRP